MGCQVIKTVALLLLVVYGALSSPLPSELKVTNLLRGTVSVLKAHPSGRIIGGNSAVPHSIPYQAFLTAYSPLAAWYCGGSLISERYVLTAGHCIDGANRADVVLGARNPLEPESTQVHMTSYDLILHDKFNLERILNDIGVVRLPVQVEVSQYVVLVPLPGDNSHSYEGQLGRVSGWGVVNGHNQQLSDTLRYVENPVISNTQCSQQFGFQIQEYQVCLSGEDGRGFCNGDSGGPLTVSGVQIGIASFGFQYCPFGSPTGYTRTASFIEWIKEHTDI